MYLLFISIKIIKNISNKFFKLLKKKLTRIAVFNGFNGGSIFDFNQIKNFYKNKSNLW